MPVVVSWAGQQTSLRQDWHNGDKYVFDNRPENVNELAEFMKYAQKSGMKTVDFMFSGDFNGDMLAQVLRIEAPLGDFANGFETLERHCTALR